MKRGFFLATLGCKVNQYESHALREAWLAKGWHEEAEPALASCILVNSCAVTAKAVADVRGCIRRLHRAAPEAAIIVSGCAAGVMGKELSALPGVVAVLPQSDKELLLADPALLLRQRAEHTALEPEPASAVPHFPAFSLSGYDRSRAVLKIQDGCSHCCAYCIVPLARGRARSRAYAESLDEARRLLASGFREIVISGVNLRQYRQDGDGDFWDFLKALDADLSPEWAERARLRVSSLEPGQLTDKALEVIAGAKLLAPHLHLSLQSGSASVLRRMGRGHYSPEAIPGFLGRLRDLLPRYALGADILTGFPGESEAEFAESLDFYRALPLTYAHVFPYSRRPGTRAASMPGQLGHALKKERAATLRALVQEKKQAFLQAQLNNSTLQVIFEDRRSGAWRGVNEFYSDCLLAPGTAEPEKNRVSPYELTRVRPTGIKNNKLLVSLK